MIRKIVKIDEDLCNGCGECIPNCAEGALQLIDGKVRLISDLFCDGLGACIGHCPEGAIEIEEREAEPYDEYKVMEYICAGGSNVIKAHLEHLKDHNEIKYLKEAIRYLQEHNMEVPIQFIELPVLEQPKNDYSDVNIQSALTHWPIQLHLISPTASHFEGSDLLLAADCTAFSFGNFHRDFLNGKTLAIACPKLDSNKQVYLDKLVTMINESNIKSITVLIMQVPCCRGLYQIAAQAVEMADREIELTAKIIGINGEILN